MAASVALHGLGLAVLALLFTPLADRQAGSLLPGLRRQLVPEPRIVSLLVLPPAYNAVPAPGVVQAPERASNPSPPGAEQASAVSNTALMVDSSPGSAPPTAGRSSLAPAAASGLLWDRRPASSGGPGRTHAELTDSAVKAIVQHYRDSLAALPGGGKLLPPTWTTSIGGKEFGLDGTYLTVAGIRLPAFLLALIPLPGANESEALDKVGQMREADYWMARPLDAAAADRRDQLKASRDRQAAEDELRKKQRDAPEP